MKKTQRRVRPGRLALFLLLMLAAVAVLAEFFFLRPARTEKANAPVPMSASAAKPFALSGDRLAAWDLGTLSLSDADGSVIWKCEAGVEGTLCAGSQYICLYTDKLFQIYSAESGKRLYEQTFATQTIEQVICSDATVTVLAKDTEGDPLIRIYNEVGDQLDSISFEGQSVVRMGYDLANDHLWVITLDQQTPAPVCRLNVYNPGKSLTGMVTIYDQICYDALVDGNTNMIVGTDQAQLFDQDGQKKADRLIYGWAVMDLNRMNDEYVLAMQAQKLDSETALGQNELQLIRLPAGDKGQDTTVKLTLPENAVDVVLGNQYVYIFAGRYVYTYTLSGESKTVRLLPIDISSVTVGAGRTSALVSDGVSLYRVPLA